MFSNPEQAFGGSVRMLSLIDTIYEAVEKPELWGYVLEEVTRAVQGDSIAIFSGAPDARTPALVADHGLPADVWGAFAGYYASINPIYPACQKTFSATENWYSERALACAEFEKTEFYQDFFRPNKMHYSMGMLIEFDDAPAASISCQRKLSAGPFPEAAGVVYETLRPHLARALQLYHRLGAAESARLGLETALDAHEHAVIGVDSLGRIMLCNRQAQALLKAADGLQSTQGRLFCTRPEDHSALHMLLASVLGPIPSAGGSILVRRAGQKQALAVTATPFSGTLPGQSARLGALLLISDPARETQPRTSLMRLLYKLTPSEARVSDLLLEGLDVREVSERLGLTLDSTRFHLKRVLAKTGARKQSELIRMMLALPVTGASDARSSWLP